MTKTSTPNALAGLGIAGLRTLLRGSPVDGFALGDNVMNARGRADAQGSGS